MLDWAIDLENRMKKNKVRWKDVAEHFGWTAQYTSGIINGNYTPKQAQEKITKAVNELIQNR